MDPEKLVIRTNVKVEIAPDDGGEPGTYVEITPKGSVSINDSRGSFTVSDFGQAMTDIDAQITNGRTVGVSFNANLVPSDTAYTGTYAKYDNGDIVYLRVTFGDQQETPATIIRRFKGRLNQWNETANQDNVAEAAINFLAMSKYTDPVTP
jgi:hypothetical protein